MKIKSLITLLAVVFALHAQTDRPVYGHDPGGNCYSPLKQITPKSVEKLQLPWSYDAQAPINLPPPSTPPRQAADRWALDRPAVDLSVVKAQSVRENQ